MHQGAARGNTLRVLKLALQFKLPLFFSLFFALTYVAGQILGVTFIGDFFSDTLIGRNFEKVNIITVLTLLGAGLLWAGSHYLSFLSSNTMAVKVIHRLREQLFQKLIDLPIPYYKQNSSGEIMSRVLNDISVIEIFLMTIIVELIAQPLTVAAVILVMFTINVKLTLYLLAVTPLLVLVLGGLGAIVQRLSHKVQKNISDITSRIQESIHGIEVIKGFGVDASIRRQFTDANDRHLGDIRKELKIRLLGTPSSEFLGVVAIIVILVLGALAVSHKMAAPGDITSFLLFALILSQPLSKIGEISLIIKKLSPAAGRIFEIIDSEQKEDFSRPDIGSIKGSICYQDVSFSYDESRPILHNIHLEIQPGETVAIVGPSGAGKSTLVSMIPAFYQPTRGSITIDGKPVSHYNPLSIRQQLSLVTQGSILFSGSIEDNIRLSLQNASPQEIETACRVANIHDFIISLPEGYQTQVGERGVNLSGGQRQRLVLARAILRKPAILILDEATSSLDAESERLISQAMDNILGHQTTLIITHKLSTIAHADRIVVIEAGTISEIGTHQELLSNGGIYQRLYKIQVDV